MSQYAIVYIGGDHPSDPEESKRHFEEYKKWLASLGDAAVSPANPFKDTQTVNSDGSIMEGSAISMSGYSIIRAESMDKALEIARACPFLDIGGTLEVSELIQMTEME